MRKRVMLERIQVMNLFDRFSYDINLKNGNNVAILHAPNGCGKTTIFNLVDFIFNPTIAKFKYVARIPFECCYCTLSTGKIIGIEMRKSNSKKQSEKMKWRHLIEDDENPYNFEKIIYTEMYLIVDDGKKYSFNITDAMKDAISYSDDESMLPFEIDSSERVAEFIDLDEQSMRMLPPSYRRRFTELIAFREKHGCVLDVNYISADRLHKQSKISLDRGYYGRSGRYSEQELDDPLSAMQNNIKALYRRTDGEYRKLVSEARDRLPKMFLRNKINAKISFEEFAYEWKEYTTNLERLYNLGLIESVEKVLEDNELKESFEHNSDFLTVYLKVFKSTLEPWNREYERMKLFADILNKRNRVTGKVLKFGFNGLVITVDDHMLPLECLSSGEKNDLIMFYNLVFKSEKGGLVLVDEPEISLHIEWQEEYLDCLLKICEMNELQAIVATHSPNIVNGHIELYAKRGLQDGHKRN